MGHLSGRGGDEGGAGAVVSETQCSLEGLGGPDIWG